MQRKFSFIIACILLLFLSAHAGKDVFHYITFPLIEGAGIYASVKSLTDDDIGISTKAASISNLTLLGTTATFGMITAFSKEDTREKLRLIHRVLGIVVTGTSLWLSISASVDKVDTPTKIVSYGYTGLTLIPIIMFSF